MTYTIKDEKWIDETGMAIPRNRVTDFEKKRERSLGKILKDAQVVNDKLKAFKALVRDEAKELFEKAMEDNEVKIDSKGNFTIFSFDRSIKLEVSISSQIKFDDLTIKAAQELLNEFLDETVESKFDFVKDLVTEAFSTSRGKLDAKKVMGLLKYRSRINHDKFHKACELIEKAITRPDSKSYYRISLRDEEGAYQNVELNFSMI